MPLTTLADVREIVEGRLPSECRERETWRYVAGALDEAARGGDIEDVVIAVRTVLQLEQEPWPAEVSCPSRKAWRLAAKA